MREISIVLCFLSLAVIFQPDAKASCRSASVKHQFDVSQGFKHGRKGFIVDHVCSLFNNGIDNISNMQYQTIADSKKKDRIENTPYGKKLYCNFKNSTPTRQVFNCK
jgi:hypothetical protein